MEPKIHRYYLHFLIRFKISYSLFTVCVETEVSSKLSFLPSFFKVISKSSKFIHFIYMDDIGMRRIRSSES